MNARLLAIGTAALSTVADVPLSAVNLMTRKIYIFAAATADAVIVKDINGVAIGEVTSGKPWIYEVSQHAENAGVPANCKDYFLRATTANDDVYCAAEQII